MDSMILGIRTSSVLPKLLFLDFNPIRKYSGLQTATNRSSPERPFLVPIARYWNEKMIFSYLFTNLSPKQKKHFL